MIDTLTRFLIGGLFVSVFAVLGDILKPKSFAGLFTLILTTNSRGNDFAAAEARSMVLGAIGFFASAWAVCHILVRYKLTASIVASVSIV
jgi:hypothetical protein